ncbi:DNA-directed RNA polymerase subunit N [Candidatus Woesearchaeota archaeon]|nr:DNA-directed RNA polymerase subunit N [Candidatus Woesearchaeota archaeon]
MIIPIRCFSCGKPIAHLFEDYKQRTGAGEPAKKVMDELGLKRYCCRALFLGHVDLVNMTGQFKKF